MALMLTSILARAGMFAIYELTADGYKLIELRRFADGRDAAIEESKE